MPTGFMKNRDGLPGTEMWREVIAASCQGSQPDLWCHFLAPRFHKIGNIPLQSVTFGLIAQPGGVARPFVLGEVQTTRRRHRTALDILARTQRRRARIGARAAGGLSPTNPEQLSPFDTLTPPKPA